LKRSTIKLLVADLDGTTIDREENLPPLNAEAFDFLRNRGVQLSVASGRAASSVVEFARRLQISVPVTAHNGSMILDPDGTVLYARLLDDGTVKSVLEEIPRRIAAYGIFTDHVLYEGDRADDRMRLLRLWGHRRYDHEEGWTRSPPGDMPMLHMIGDVEDVKEAAQRLGHIPGITPRIYASGRSRWHHLEVRAGSDDKGSALKWLMNHLGLEKESVMAAGDWLNDIPMLIEAGCSVAMPEASDEVKNAASFTAPLKAAEGGLGRFILDYFGA